MTCARLGVAGVPAAAVCVKVILQILNQLAMERPARREPVQYLLSLWHSTPTAPGMWRDISATSKRETRPAMW